MQHRIPAGPAAAFAVGAGLLPSGPPASCTAGFRRTRASMSVACATFRARTKPGKRAPTVELCESNEQYVPLNDGYNWKGDPNATLSGQGVPQYAPGPRSAAAAAGGHGRRAPAGAPPPPARPGTGRAVPYDPATGDYIGPDGSATRRPTWRTPATRPGSRCWSRRGPSVGHGRTFRSRFAEVGRHEAVADQPRRRRRDGTEIAVAAVMVEADLGEDREVAGDSRLVRRHFGEADVRHVVAHDALDARRLGGRVRCGHGATEKLDDGSACPAPARRRASSSSPSSQKDWASSSSRIASPDQL